ncbi:MULTISPECIES: hypothetical protein [unclassified Streptomyces]|uniref:hypothetical protein n=1 Tax=unclassified Streptomyces TaxID=2593676 RepID=UPI0006FD2CB4|nr:MULTISPECIES: hypothetical protein [unclassified Streptomyces]KQX50578.1 hypothetical protein ASD33_10900 [Streptomyces sp. Root1304]KRA84742.1 hypothetical protein ASE09_10905 [Streptomyces sp. Root66D1]
MRTHRAERGRRAEGALAHLLLVVVLALGVFLMHAVGHPEGAGGDTASAHTSSSSTAASSASMAASSSAAVPSSPGTGQSAHAASSAAVNGHSAVPPGGDDSSDARHGPGSGMDMTTLCVAVLAGWLFAGLVRAALARRPEWLALLLARLTPALGPHAPPPRPPDLSLLSVLRI